MITYDVVSMAAMLRDFESPKYIDREHQLLTDIADSLYNVGIDPSQFTAEYKDLYDQYGKSFWDKVLRDMRAIDSQITSDRGARELAADYYDRVGDADFYEDYYGSSNGASGGYGVYSYRNGQEESYTYAKDYDEAIREAKWDLTHKKYIDYVRIIDNTTGEIFGEFDSLDSIGEGCSPRRKSKKKKVLNQGCGSKRRVRESIEEEVTPDNIYDIAVRTLPKEDIDHHASDLYLRKTPESTELVNKMKYRNSGLLSTFRSNIDGDIWYELPFCYGFDWRERDNYMGLGESKRVKNPRKKNKQI